VLRIRNCSFKKGALAVLWQYTDMSDSASGDFLGPSGKQRI
jgi:hypothetical protein